MNGSCKVLHYTIPSMRPLTKLLHLFLECSNLLIMGLKVKTPFTPSFLIKLRLLEKGAGVKMFGTKYA
jgi:hypothetical protein